MRQHDGFTLPTRVATLLKPSQREQCCERLRQRLFILADLLFAKSINEVRWYHSHICAFIFETIPVSYINRSLTTFHFQIPKHPHHANEFARWLLHFGYQCILSTSMNELLDVFATTGYQCARNTPRIYFRLRSYHTVRYQCVSIPNRWTSGVASTSPSNTAHPNHATVHI